MVWNVQGFHPTVSVFEENDMRKIGATLVAASLLVSSAAFAADAPANSPLPAGKPAGTQQAALEMGGVWLVLGLAAAAGIIAAIASGTQGNSSNATSTTH
jgi:carbohydrate-selective porin OprB